MKFLFSKRISWLWLAVFVILAFYGYGFFHHRPFDNGEDYQKIVILNDNGLEFQIKTKQKTVADLLNEKKIILEKNDQIFPNQQSKIFNRQKIEIRRAVKLTFEVDSKTVEGWNKKSLGLVLIIAGATQNLIDRLLFGCVVDFIPFFNYSIFNLGDIAITLGALSLILGLWPNKK